VPNAVVNLLDLSLLSAMLAPAFFLTACGSMLLNANNRLARISDRLREALTELQAAPEHTPPLAERSAVLRTRAHIILSAIRLLHIGICMFVATSLAIGIEGAMHVALPLLPTALAVIGVSFLFGGTVQMWREARLSVRSLELMVERLDRGRAQRVETSADESGT
jgi:uncharacterized membrane protein YbaN (DUF454 family)